MESDYLLGFHRDVCAFSHVIIAVAQGGGAAWIYTTESAEGAKVFTLG